MNAPRVALLAVLAALAAAPASAQPGPETGERIAAFLLRGPEGSRTFVASGADEAALGAAAKEWAVRASSRSSTLALVSAPGTAGESRLALALERWNGKVARASDAAAFLEDAAARSEGLLSDPRVSRDLGARGSSAEQNAAIERARRLSGRRRPGAGVFGPDRDPGSLDGRGADGRGPGGTGATASAGGRGNNPPPSQGLIAAGGGVGTGGSQAAAGATGIPAGAYLPSANVPANFKTKGGEVPSPVRMDESDRTMNKVLSVVNMEQYSRAGTVNKESFEGSQAAICRFLIQAKYDPSEAWSLSKQARDAKGADPGDLDLRNAEHYLYAYSTTAKPSGIGDSTGVQLLMAAGWGGFKTVTKHFRPTSTPTLDETKWGLKGAWHGQHPPDWKSVCEPGKRSAPKAVEA